MANLIRYVAVIWVRRARTWFLHRAVEGVEIVKWPKERCIRQFVLIVGRNVKFRLSLTLADLFTAVNAGRRRETREEDSRSS